MSVAITVSRAQPHDAERVGAIGRASYLDHFRDAWQPDALARWLDEQFDVARIGDEIAGNVLTYLLAESDNGALLGFAKLWHARPLPVPPGDIGAELQKIYLRQDALGGGAGAALLAATVAAARACAARFVWLDVLQSNARAVRFYRRHGFDTCGERAFQAGDSLLPLWVMRLPL